MHMRLNKTKYSEPYFECYAKSYQELVDIIKFYAIINPRTINKKPKNNSKKKKEYKHKRKIVVDNE